MWPPLRPYMYSDLYPNSHLHAVCPGAVVKYPFICVGFWRRKAESVTSSRTEMSVMVEEEGGGGGPRELNQGCWCCGGTKMRVVTASLQLWPTWASAGTLSSSQPPPSLIPSLSFSLSSLPFAPSSAHLHFQIDFWEAPPPSAYAQILLALFSHSLYHPTPFFHRKTAGTRTVRDAMLCQLKDIWDDWMGKNRRQWSAFPHGCNSTDVHKANLAWTDLKGRCVCVCVTVIHFNAHAAACMPMPTVMWLLQYLESVGKHWL